MDPLTCGFALYTVTLAFVLALRTLAVLREDDTTEDERDVAA